jgi:hypothetical protein
MLPAPVTKPTAEASFGRWSTPEVSLTIEYAVEAMEQIRAAVCDGLQQLAHGGMEVGGVLFGLRAGNSIRILKWRPIACEHAEGPSLRLSARDRIGLTRLLEEAKSDPELAGMQPLGWFLSHPRSDIFMTAADLEIFGGFFPEPGQVTLVLRPSRLGPARAGFFVREADGTLKADSSHKDFTVEPLHRGAPPVERRKAERRVLPLPPLVQAEQRSAPRPLPAVARQVEPPRFLLEKSRPPSSGRWLWAIPGCLAILITAALIQQKSSAPVDPSFAFRTYNSGATVQIEWDPNSASVRGARQAAIEIKDGSETHQFPLTGSQLLSGKMPYTPKAADVEFRMTVQPGSGPPVQGFARLVGPPPPSSAPQAPVEVVESSKDRRKLEAEVKRLKEELRKEGTRAKKLQDTVRILQNRVDVDTARKAIPEVKQDK